VAALGLIDPVGTKLSDDANPLGTPPTFSPSILVLFVYAAVCALGAFLLWRSVRNRPAGWVL